MIHMLLDWQRAYGCGWIHAGIVISPLINELKSSMDIHWQAAHVDSLQSIHADGRSLRGPILT